MGVKGKWRQWRRRHHNRHRNWRTNGEGRGELENREGGGGRNGLVMEEDLNGEWTEGDGWPGALHNDIANALCQLAIFNRHF
jgi:hypothetical protein